jgi:hypothetical protein
MARAEINDDDITSQDIDYGETIPDDPILMTTPVESRFNQVEIRTLWDRYKTNELNLNPDFQRHYVWNDKQASNLIESLLLKVPIPAIFLALKEDGSKDVIDGQQRLTSIFNYMDDKFALLGINKENTAYYNKKFSDLDKKSQNLIKNYYISAIEINIEKNPDIIYDMFKRINSGSVRLNPQELRNSVYRGKYNTFIKEISKDKNFKYIIDASVGTHKSWEKRMYYEELVLLFFTMLHLPGGIDRLKGSITVQLLNKEMENNISFDDAKAKIYKREFENTIVKLKGIFDKNTFRVFDVINGYIKKGRGSFNKGLYISMVYIFAQSRYDRNRLMAKKDLIVESIKTVMVHNTDFKAVITEGTMDANKTRTRIDIITELLDKIIEDTPPQLRNFNYAFKKALFENNPTCAICQQKIDHIEDAEVDHILAFVMGGTTTSENAQLAHRYCNRQKGNRYTG